MKPTGIYPVVRPGVNDQFFCKSPDGSVYVEQLAIGTNQPGLNIGFKTGYLRTNVSIDLLGISFLEELELTGKIGPTDLIGPAVRLKSLAIGMADGTIISTLDVTRDPTSPFSFSPEGNSRRMILNFQSSIAMLNGGQKAVNLMGELMLDIGTIKIVGDRLSDDEIGVIGYQLNAYRESSQPPLKEKITDFMSRFARGPQYNPTLRQRYPDRVEEIGTLLRGVLIPQIVTELNDPSTSKQLFPLPKAIVALVELVLAPSVPIEHRVSGLQGVLGNVLVELLLDTRGIEYFHNHPKVPRSIGEHLFLYQDKVEYVGPDAKPLSSVFDGISDIHYNFEDILRRLHLSLSDKRSTTSPTPP